MKKQVENAEYNFFTRCFVSVESLKMIYFPKNETLDGEIVIHVSDVLSGVI